jgi:hypothetical protein
LGGLPRGTAKRTGIRIVLGKILEERRKSIDRYMKRFPEIDMKTFLQEIDHDTIMPELREPGKSNGDVPDDT